MQYFLFHDRHFVKYYIRAKYLLEYCNLNFKMPTLEDAKNSIDLYKKIIERKTGLNNIVMHPYGKAFYFTTNINDIYININESKSSTKTKIEKLDLPLVCFIKIDKKQKLIPSFGRKTVPETKVLKIGSEKFIDTREAEFYKAYNETVNKNGDTYEYVIIDLPYNKNFFTEEEFFKLNLDSVC